MNKNLIKGMIWSILLGSAIGVNAQSRMNYEENGSTYDVIQEESQEPINKINTLITQEETFKLDITIPYLGENGYIESVNLSRYDNEGDRGEHYWEGRDLDKEIPIDKYYIQIIARDDNNYYSLYAKTDNGTIKFTESDLVCTEIYNESLLRIQRASVGPKENILLERIYHINIQDMDSKDSITVVSNKNLKSSVGIYLIDDSDFLYSLKSEMSMESDQEVVFGNTYTSSYNSINKQYTPNQSSNISLTNQILIEDEYGNRLNYLGNSRYYGASCIMTLSKEGYVDTQEVEVNGSIRFIAPSEEGIYHFKLEFNKDLPDPIPSIEGQLYVGEKQQDSEEEPEESTGVHDFVTNLYRYCMDREPDEVGLNSWVQQLKNKETTAADTLKFFLNSPEFQNKQTSNQTYIDSLYKVCMGRAGDVGGIEYWNSILQAGESRNNILVKFVDSTEFDNICTNYGVVRGSLESEVADNTEQIKDFVTRFYNNCLGRAPEQEGLEYWTQGLKEGHLTGAELGRSFITSTEMINKNLSTEGYLGMLYDTFMGRSADESGKQYWMQCIATGMTREQVMNSFIGSTEFNLICQEYGIRVGL